MSAQKGKQYAWVGNFEDTEAVREAVDRVQDINVGAGYSPRVESTVVSDGDNYYVVISTNGICGIFDTVGEWVSYMGDHLSVDYMTEVDPSTLRLV